MQNHASIRNWKGLAQSLPAVVLNKILKFPKISKVLRILPEYLSAIEKAEVDRLPAPAYIIGYIRSYANHLNLPSAELCQAMQNALGHEDRRPEFDFIENRALSPTGSGRVALGIGSCRCSALCRLVCFRYRHCFSQ